MIAVEIEVRLKRGAEEVFDFLTCADNFVRWQEGLVRVEQLDPGAWRVGTRLRSFHGFLIWKNLEDHSEITALEYAKRIANRGAVGKTKYQEEFRLEQEGDATLLRYSAEIEPSGIFAYIKTISAWNFRSQMRRSFRNLQRVLEKSIRVPA